MKLANRFPDDEKMRVWLDHQYCVLCGINQGCSLHHIDGCSKPCHRSIFNSVMLCMKCHKIADSHNTDSPLSEKYRLRLRNYTYDLITSQDKPHNQYDKEYLIAYPTDLAQHNVQRA